MKKNVRILFCLVMVLIVALCVLTACGDQTNNNSTVNNSDNSNSNKDNQNDSVTTPPHDDFPNVGHVHKWSTVWEKDGVRHWHVCTIDGCIEKTDEAEHSFDNGVITTEPSCVDQGTKTYTCKTCGQTKLEIINANGHIWSNEWDKNAICHWHICTVEGCLEKNGYAEHSYNNLYCFCGQIDVSKATVGLKYTLNNDKRSYSVTGIGSVTDKDIIIPSEYDGKPVSSIGNSAFKNCLTLTSVAVGNCVKTIGDFAFNGCSKLTSITISNSVTSISNNSFYGCSNLESIKVVYGNVKYHSDMDCLIETDSKKLLLGCKNSVIPIDGSVTRIGDNAFYNSGLTSITIPDSVTSIGSHAFYCCRRLTSVIIGNGVTSIDDNAFCWCDEMSNITIGNSVTSIGDHAFFSSKLLNVIIPNSVTSIGDSAFRECKALKSVELGNGVTSIGESAFSGCIGLLEIIIPDSTTSIGRQAFIGCSRLTNVTIGNGVTIIGNEAFYQCSKLTSVKIGCSVTSIGYRAFCNDFNLTSVIFGNASEWKVSKNEDMSNSVYLLESDLSNESTAIKYLTANYVNYYWKRSDQ